MKKNIIIFLAILFAIRAHAYDIDPGQTYKISLSADAGKTLSVKNASLSSGAEVVLWIETDVNAQRWTIAKNEDDTYKLANVYSKKILYRKGDAAEGAKVCQYNSSSSGSGRWELTPVGGKDDCYYIVQAGLYLTSLSAENGAAMTLTNKKDDPEAALQTWKIESVSVQPDALTPAVCNELMAGFKAKYYKQASTGYRLTYGSWWSDAEMFEVALDAYETTGNPEHETMFRELYKNFISRNQANWNYNKYNDDIAWMIIASARAYLMFGDTDYLSNAKDNFDRMYARALLPSGMLRWKESADTKNRTNSCINGPAGVAACYLAMATGDESYYAKAKDLYRLQRKYLYAPATGRVYDSFTWSGDKPSDYNYWASTYNQGTFLGAATLLYNHYGDQQYKDDAAMIMKYTAEKLCDANGIINVCQVGNGDLAGFKGILMRYVRRYIVDLEQPQYVEWIQKNALQAYNNRNSAGITSSAWLTKTPESFVLEDCSEKCDFNTDPFGPSTAVSAAFNALLDANLIEKHAFSTIEAEDFDYLKGVYVQEGTDDDTPELGNVKDGFYTAYQHVNFGNNLATSVEVRVSKSEFSGSEIEIRLDSPQGDSIGTVSVPSGAGDGLLTVSQEIIPVDGKRNVYLVCKGAAGQSNLFRINWFRFKAAGQMYPDITDNGGEITASPAGDGLENLIDNRLNTKFVIPGDGGVCWFQYQSPVAVSVKGYALASADGASEKDPKAWTLQASNDGLAWVDLDEQADQQFEGRCQKKEYGVTATTPYTHFRLLVTGRNGSAGELQLAEWQLYGAGIFENDITADGGSLSAQYEGDGADETYSKATDKNAETNYSVTGRSDLWIAYKAKGTYRLSSYSLTSADDAPGRDPGDWIVYGSTDGKNWTAIDQQSNQKFPYRNSTQHYNCDTEAGYRYFKLHITANNGAETTQLAEWQLFGDFYFDRFYNDVMLNGGELTSSQETEANSPEIKALTDKNGNTEYRLDAAALPVWVQYKSTVPVQLRAYSITVGADNTKYPKSWALQGSNDGQQWTDIHTRANTAFVSKGERRTYGLSSTLKYTYFRIHITKLSDDEATEVKIGEWELHGTGISTTDITSGDGMLDAEYQGISAGEGAGKLIDNSENTKYCTRFYGSAWVNFQSARPAEVTLYSITAADDQDARDPRSWTLEASNDGESWELVDSRSNQVFPYRHVTQYYACAQPAKPFTHFRLNITENNGAEGLLQLAEWQLLEIEPDPPVSLQSVDYSDGMIFYPNPVWDVLHIDSSESGTVSLYTVAGQILLERKLERGTQSLDLERYEKGIYLLVMQTGGKVVCKKLIKK